MPQIVLMECIIPSSIHSINRFVYERVDPNPTGGTLKSVQFVQRDRLNFTPKNVLQVDYIYTFISMIIQ